MEHLGTLEEVRAKYDKTVVMAQEEDVWFMLLGGKEDITNHDLYDACAMLIKFTVELGEKHGEEGAVVHALNSFHGYKIT